MKPGQIDQINQIQHQPDRVILIQKLGHRRREQHLLRTISRPIETSHQPTLPTHPKTRPASPANTQANHMIIHRHE